MAAVNLSWGLVGTVLGAQPAVTANKRAQKRAPPTNQLQQ